MAAFGSNADYIDWVNKHPELVKSREQIVKLNNRIETLTTEVSDLHSEIDDCHKRMVKMREALELIVKWSGEEDDSDAHHYDEIKMAALDALGLDPDQVGQKK